MAKYIYKRVSTQNQGFDQQEQDINAYFTANGISMAEISGTVEEKESGGTSYTDRELAKLLNRCKQGDTIFAASTDRLGRNFVDMIRMMEAAKQRGITIVACKQGLSLSDDSMATKIILSVTAIIDEDERMRIKHRVKNGVNAAIAELRQYGSRMTRHDTEQRYWGNYKGIGLEVAREARALKLAEEKMQWREQSEAVRFTLRKYGEGWGVVQIAEELGKLYDDRAQTKPGEPNTYATPTGCKPQKGTVSKWIREANPLVLVG